MQNLLKIIRDAAEKAKIDVLTSDHAHTVDVLYADTFLAELDKAIEEDAKTKWGGVGPTELEVQPYIKSEPWNPRSDQDKSE
jgi:hypothetical protein